MPKGSSASIARRECDNCGNWFDVDNRVPNKKFCRDACRKEFWQTGGQFRKVRRFMEKLLPELVRAAFVKQATELEAMRDEMRQERELIQGMVARFERAKQADILISQERDRPSRRGAAA